MTEQKQTVTILSVEERSTRDGRNFRLITVGGEPYIYTSSTGRPYLDITKARIISNLSKVDLDSLIGVKLPGKVVKTETTPYEWTNPSTKETKILTHKYEVVWNDPELIKTVEKLASQGKNEEAMELLKTYQ